jgi:hypothetical protein
MSIQNPIRKLEFLDRTVTLGLGNKSYAFSGLTFGVIAYVP